MTFLLTITFAITYQDSCAYLCTLASFSSSFSLPEMPMTTVGFRGPWFNTTLDQTTQKQKDKQTHINPTQSYQPHTSKHTRHQHTYQFWFVWYMSASSSHSWCSMCQRSSLNTRTAGTDALPNIIVHLPLNAWLTVACNAPTHVMHHQ